MLLILSAVFVFVLIICGFLFHLYNRRKSVLWDAPSKIHLDNVIDNAHFFRKLNSLDLMARNARSVDQYISKYKSCMHRFDAKEITALNDLIEEISSKYINKYQKLQRIPWKLVKFEGVEENFPHTLNDCIFISPDFFKESDKKKQIETLIHEKIHVYQRFYTIETSKLLTSLGFSIWGSHASKDNLRTNPDTDSYIYQYKGTAQAQLYNTVNPKSIRDSETVVVYGKDPWDVPSSIKQQDHPFEIMACGISQYIMKTLSPDSDYKEKLMSWCNEFL